MFFRLLWFVQLRASSHAPNPRPSVDLSTAPGSAVKTPLKRKAPRFRGSESCVRLLLSPLLRQYQQKQHFVQVNKRTAGVGEWGVQLLLDFWEMKHCGYCFRQYHEKPNCRAASVITGQNYAVKRPK